MRNLFIRLFAWLTGLSGSVWTFIEPILKDSAGRLLQQALPLALEIVASLAQTEMSGEQKREAAVRALKGKLRQTGIEMAGSVLNLAVETAYQRMLVEDGRREIGDGGSTL